MSENIYMSKLGGYIIPKRHGEFLELSEFGVLVSELQKAYEFLRQHHDPNYADVSPIVNAYLAPYVESIVYPFEMPKRSAKPLCGVYFAICDRFPNQIKIGQAENLKIRMKSLCHKYKAAVIPIGFIPSENPYPLEQMLHLYFDLHRVTGSEWFAETPVLYFLENGL